MTTTNLPVMKEAQKRFLYDLSIKIAELHALLDSFILHEPQTLMDQIQQLYRIVHTLKGSAPIFGYPEIGTVAEGMVTIWEWSQELDQPGSIPPIDLVITKTKSMLQQLEIEYEICQTEVKSDSNDGINELKYLELHQYRLLLIDDDEVLRSFLKRRLQTEGYQVDEAGDIRTAERMLREEPYQLIVLDLMMYPDSGYQLFEFLKDDPTLKWIPLIVLSGRDDSKDKIRCFRLGADDYVTKPFHYKELEARIYSLLMRRKQFEELAFRDALTGVYNRRYFDHELQLECKRAQRYQFPLSIGFLDIDRFKAVNDTYGHHIGDMALQGLGYTLQKLLRSTDLLARYGGEEFVIVFPETKGELAVKQLEEILAQLHQNPIVQHEGLELSITFSAGVAEWSPDNSIEQWLRSADHAMYQAKKQGRDRVLLHRGDQIVEVTEKDKPKRVLLADDDAIIRSILTSKLSSFVEIIQAHDGVEAYEKLCSEKVDVCILDGIMPNMDGFTLLERIKSDQTFADVKVLMLSGRKKEEDVIRGLRLGADDYMSKPFSLIELELRVKRLLNL